MMDKPRLKRLFFDIEVSPNIGLFWAPGFKLSITPDQIIKERAIICIAYSWEGSSRVEVIRWDKSQNDRSMLEEFLPIANSADEIVGHFSDFFDIPWFRTRCLFHGLEPLPQYKTIDTKAWASKYFYFNSNKLDYLSKFFGRKGKIKTDYKLWYDVTVHNSQKALNYMCNYCKGDIVELKFVFNKLASCCKPKTHVGVLAGGDKWSCPSCGSEDVTGEKKRVSAQGVITYQMHCQECGAYHTVSNQTHETYKASKCCKKVSKVQCNTKARGKRGDKR